MGREKTKRKEKEEEERSGRKVEPGLNGKKLGASDSGAELDAKIYGARATGGELPAMSPPPFASSTGARHQRRWRRDVLARRQHQWRRAKSPYSEIFPHRSICEKFSKKS